MRILLCNIDMRYPTGTVIVTRDLALNLRRRGHQVTVFSPQVGVYGQELRGGGVAVVDDIEQAGPPEVIHGHHGLPTIAAMARFPVVPAIWVAHGRNGWFDLPPRFDRIYRYLPVDDVRFDILHRVYAIPKARMELFPNAVDLGRIAPRAVPLPARPAEVLVVAKSPTDIPTLGITCGMLGLKLKAIGIGAGQPTLVPERFMRKAHIVVATGRCALEAVCAGAAVVVGDQRGIAGMLTPDNWAVLRRLNFGTSSLIQPVKTDTFKAQFARYDSAVAAAVTATARAEADLQRAIDRLEQLYRDAIAANPAGGWSRRDAEVLDGVLAEWPVPAGEPQVWDGLRRQLTSVALRNKALAG